MGEAKQSRFRVVIGVDFLDESTQAIYEGVHLARSMPNIIDLHFAHVIPAPHTLHDARVVDALAERLGRTMIKLERFVRDALFVFGGTESWGCDVAFHVRVGPPARELHQVAVDVDAEMIILGAHHAARGLRRWFQRSTAETLVRTAHVPVVIAHPKNYRGLERTVSSDVARPGEDLTRSGLTSYTYVDFGSEHRDSHLSGLV